MCNSHSGAHASSGCRLSRTRTPPPPRLPAPNTNVTEAPARRTTGRACGPPAPERGAQRAEPSHHHTAPYVLASPRISRRSAAAARRVAAVAAGPHIPCAHPSPRRAARVGTCACAAAVVARLLEEVASAPPPPVQSPVPVLVPVPVPVPVLVPLLSPIIRITVAETDSPALTMPPGSDHSPVSLRLTASTCIVPVSGSRRVTIGSAVWLAPHCASRPRPRMPVRPLGLIGAPSAPKLRAPLFSKVSRASSSARSSCTLG